MKEYPPRVSVAELRQELDAYLKYRRSGGADRPVDEPTVDEPTIVADRIHISQFLRWLETGRVGRLDSTEPARGLGPSNQPTPDNPGAKDFDWQARDLFKKRNELLNLREQLPQLAREEEGQQAEEQVRQALSAARDVLAEAVIKFGILTKNSGSGTGYGAIPRGRIAWGYQLKLYGQDRDDRVLWVAVGDFERALSSQRTLETTSFDLLFTAFKIEGSEFDDLIREKGAPLSVG
jgi:hypothetical protein